MDTPHGIHYFCLQHVGHCAQGVERRPKKNTVDDHSRHPDHRCLGPFGRVWKFTFNGNSIVIIAKKNFMATVHVQTFKRVSYLWDEKKAAELAGNEVALLIYRSNLLGADLRLTNYGGGNTSCKAMAKDPLTGKETEIMWVKGSGGDIGTLKKSGLAALYVDRLRSLKNIYRGIQHEDEMVELFNHCIYDLASKAPSIDTPLHGFLPFKHIDHLHPDAAIAIAAAKDGRKITEKLF